MWTKSEMTSEKDDTMYIPVNFKNKIGCYEHADFSRETDEIRINCFNRQLGIVNKNVLIEKNRYSSSTKFNKYDLHRIINEIEELKPYIPPTEMFHNFKSIVEFIEKNEKVILKPVDILSNEEICIIEKTEDGFKIKDKRCNINTILYTVEELKRYIEKEKESLQDYIVQKYINRARIEQSVYDIRTVMKKKKREWEINEIECKVGRNNFTFTNNYIRNNSLLLSEMLKNSLPVGCHYDTIMDEIEKINTIICNTLGSFNNEFLEILIDTSIDRDRKLWLTEINVLPHFRGFKITDYKVYTSLAYSLLLYGANK